ncbi:YciI family protein [Mumia zhuanghuii]|uniref:Transcription initiation protein n=1 Tax=Mumia zhuanghuii TaxID=2585211 RepID=A0A5C4MUA3_9ACTN|nr:YciI family protein [Mumia zhuanghuii]TNC47343.1 transcription initiation protein [Mumia zhuanghuii]TNC47678.1 transcription initiation protein [Mumia zhuanghuii]
MKYLMLICGDENLDLSPEETAAIGTATDAWVREATERGVRLDGNRLARTDAATSVRSRDGELLVTDGPFAETREQVGGYDVLECADLDEALEVAASHPVARIGTIELRPFWDQ